MPSAARIVGAVAAAIVVAGSGFAAGRLTAPETDTGASDCTEVRKVFDNDLDNISSSQDVGQKQTDLRTLSNMILQNPDCFSAKDRATAQTFLDTAEQRAQQDAIDDLRSDMEECVEDATDEYSWSAC